MHSDLCLTLERVARVLLQGNGARDHKAATLQSNAYRARVLRSGGEMSRFSPEVVEAFKKAGYGTEGDYIRARETASENFQIPAAKIIDGSAADVSQRIQGVGGKELWFTNIIIDRSANIDPARMDAVLRAVTTLQTSGALPAKVKVFLMGVKDVPLDGIHPKTVKAIQGGLLGVPSPYRVYAAGQRMVEMCWIIEKGGGSKAYGMACGVSNFNEYPTAVTLQSFGVSVKAGSWKQYVTGATLNATEKFIQIFKCAAQNGDTYKMTDAAAIQGKLKGRLELIGEAQRAGTDGYTPEQWVEYNDYISKQLMELMKTERSPKVQKKLGNCATLGNMGYFATMNGAPFTPDSPNYDRVGVNALFMAVGTMIRMLQGDRRVLDITELCTRYKIQFHEAAVHCQIENAAKIDCTFGSAPDLPWGSCGDYPRQSPDFDKVVEYKAPGAPKPIHAAFGAGLCLVADACNDQGSIGRAARHRLGVEESALMKITDETIRQAAQRMIDEIPE